MGSINKSIMCYLLAIGNFVGIAVEVFHLIDNINMGMSLTWPIVMIVFFAVFAFLWLHDGIIEHRKWNKQVEDDSNE